MPAANTQLTDVTTIPAGASHNIPFAITGTGAVTVTSVPNPVPLKNQTETGRLGRIELIRVTSPPTTAAGPRLFAIGSKHMDLSYTATPADVASGVKWICRVFNDTLFPIQFSTTLSIPQALTASFSVDLLNSMLDLAARTADLRLHLQTTQDGSAASIASWSIALASNLPAAPVRTGSNAPSVVLKNRVEVRLALAPLDVFTVHVPVVGDVQLADGLIVADSLFGLGLRLDGQNGIVATLVFDAPNMSLDVTIHDTGFDITGVVFQTFQVELTVDFDGRVSVDGQIVASARIAGQTVDLGNAIRNVLLQKIAQNLPPQTSDAAQVKRALFGFIANLMRLNEVVVRNTKTQTVFTGQILDVAIADPALVASYLLVPTQPQTDSHLLREGVREGVEA